MEDTLQLTTEETSKLQQAINQLERDYYRPNPNNPRLINAIKQAVLNQEISYEDLGLTEEVFNLMVSDVKQQALNLCNVFIVDGDNSPADLFTAYEKGESPLHENEKLFVQAALKHNLINFPEDIIPASQEYALSLKERRVINRILSSDYRKLREENEIARNGFWGFRKFSS